MLSDSTRLEINNRDTETRSPKDQAADASPSLRRRKGRRSDTVRALVAALPAVVVCLALFAWLVARARAGTAAVGMQMPAMDLKHRVGYWWPFLMGDALGITALIWAYLAVVLGLAYRTRALHRFGARPGRLNELHRDLSITTLLLMTGHVVFVAAASMNNAMNARVVNIAAALIPFDVAWNTWPYAYGIVAFYLALLLGPSYYLRRRLGVRTWRIAHRATGAVYLLSVLHALYFDDFAAHGLCRTTLWLAQIPLMILLAARLRSSTRTPQQPS